jgi:hypothetical protein
MDIHTLGRAGVADGRRRAPAAILSTKAVAGHGPSARGYLV